MFHVELSLCIVNVGNKDVKPRSLDNPARNFLVSASSFSASLLLNRRVRPWFKGRRKDVRLTRISTGSVSRTKWLLLVFITFSNMLGE